MAQVGNGGQSVGEAPASPPLAKRAWDTITSGLWGGFGWFGLLMAAWVAKGQISAIVAEATPTGQYSISGLLGFGQLTNVTAAPHATLNAWDQASALFITGFAMLGLILLRHRKNTRLGSWLLWLVVGGYAIELIVGAVTLGT